MALMTIDSNLPSITPIPGAFEGDGGGKERDYYEDIIHFK